MSLRPCHFLAPALLLLLLAWADVRAEQVLPPESAVPGERSEAVALPPESSLPPSEGADQLPPPRQLPAESELPPAGQADPARSAGGRPDAEQDPARLDDSPDRTPWLRLHLSGHTAGLRCLAFTPDSQRLCTAGDDKSVIVWRRHLDAQRGSEAWIYERSIRWQIQRGPRGRIYALAASDRLLALAGDSAMDQVRIVLVDPTTGQWSGALLADRVGPHPIVVSLAFSPDPQRPGIVSMEMDGRATYWSPEPQTGIWQARQLQPPDREALGEAEASRLLNSRRFSPVAMLSGELAVVPEFAGRDAAGQAQWRLRTLNVLSGVANTLGGGDASSLHRRMILALAASPGGRRLASADDAGRVFVYDLERGGQPRRFQLNAPVLSLAFGLDQRLLLGGYRGRSSAGAELQLWDLRDIRQPRTLATASLDEHAIACAISPAGDAIAIAQGSSAEIRSTTTLQPTALLRAPIEAPRRVAFARQKPYYRIAWGYGDSQLTHGFDLAAVQLGRDERLDQDAWIPPTWWQGPWSVTTVPASPADGREEESYWLAKAGQRLVRLPLRPDREGAPTATCWIPDRRGQPWAVAVGTDGQNNLYVFRLHDRQPCLPLRVFRGHEAAVTSLGVSRDLRYLVSTSLDSTIRVWPLRDIGGGGLLNRWGASFAVADQTLSVTQLREDGPLYFRGLRPGDKISQLRWRTPAGLIATNAPDEMLDALGARPWDEMLAFDSLRAGRVAETFQLFPAWQQIASLVIAENRQWAYWTPAGFYDASFEGHKLFGWQVNRGAHRPPDFFLAAQLRRRLERPEIMSRLLEAGSLEQAFRAASLEPPVNSARAVEDQYAAKPQVVIREPDPAVPLAGDRATIEAVVTIPPGEQAVLPKAFANGVLAGSPRLISESAAAEGQQRLYRWEARLPADRQILIQVFAATTAEVPGAAELVVQRAELPPSVAPRLFVLAAGINQYQDAQLPRLDFAVSNALQFTDTLRTGASTLYRSQALSLLDQNVTRPVWQVTMEHYADRLREQVSPDDLLVLFLSGHGVRDRQSDRYYFLTADTRFGDVMARRYGDCLAFEDFTAQLAEVPCRKLVVLDTCHSGAVQPLRQQQLKAALRALQDDLAFTLTASEGDQEAVETRERRLGRFTSRLIEALEGRADQQGGDRDGIVTLDEAIEYVKRTVMADSAADPERQYPTAGPGQLLPYVRLPLTRSQGTPHTAGIGL